MPAYPALHNKIITLFSEKLNWEAPSIDTDLVETGILDSLALVNLLLHLEEEFGMKISIDKLEIDNFRCIAKIAEFVVNHNGAKVNT